MSYMIMKERLERLEKAIDNWITVMFRYGDRIARLEKQLIETNRELEKLRSLVVLEKMNK